MSIGMIFFLLFLGVLGALLIVALIEHFARSVLGIYEFPPITQDIWNMLKRIPSAITSAISSVLRAIGEFFASPFKAFAKTLSAYGLPPHWAWFLAIIIILVVMLLIIFAAIKVRELL